MEARRTSSPSRAFETGPRPPPPPPSQLSSCCLSRCLRSCLRSRMRTPQPSSPDTLSAPTAMEIERRPPWSQGARTPHPRCADLRGACKPTARCRSPRVQALRVGEGVGDTEPSPLVPLSFHASPRPALKRAATNARGCARSLRSGVRDSDGTVWPCVELDARWTCASELGDAAVERVDTTTKPPRGWWCFAATPERGEGRL